MFAKVEFSKFGTTNWASSKMPEVKLWPDQSGVRFKCLVGGSLSQGRLIRSASPGAVGGGPGLLPASGSRRQPSLSGLSDLLLRPQALSAAQRGEVVPALSGDSRPHLLKDQVPAVSASAARRLPGGFGQLSKELVSAALPSEPVCQGELGASARRRLSVLRVSLALWALELLLLRGQLGSLCHFWRLVLR